MKLEYINGMEPREVVKNWVSAFNRADANELVDFYAENAVNHQVVQEPIKGRDAIREMFSRESERATMVCQIENTFFQCGYFNELSFLRQQGLPLPTE